jgi:hypothetical protein
MIRLNSPISEGVRHDWARRNRKSPGAGEQCAIYTPGLPTVSSQGIATDYRYPRWAKFILAWPTDQPSEWLLLKVVAAPRKSPSPFFCSFLNGNSIQSCNNFWFFKLVLANAAHVKNMPPKPAANSCRLRPGPLCSLQLRGSPSRYSHGRCGDGCSNPLGWRRRSLASMPRASAASSIPAMSR